MEGKINQRKSRNNQVEEDELGGSYSTNGGEEECL
jgi:hypothetical protein